ncbi:MAG: hypothetical protein R3C56_00265 [Pirellulaceae bacterium]
MKAKKLFKSYRSYLTFVVITLFAASVQGQPQRPSRAASGPLRVDPVNSRYFSDGAGKPIYLTGSHTWASLQDCGLDVGRSESSDPPPEFDFDAYLKLLTDNNHNFIRLYAGNFHGLFMGRVPTSFRSLNRGVEPAQRWPTMASPSTT